LFKFKYTDIINVLKNNIILIIYTLGKDEFTLTLKDNIYINIYIYIYIYIYKRIFIIIVNCT